MVALLVGVGCITGSDLMVGPKISGSRIRWFDIVIRRILFTLRRFLLLVPPPASSYSTHTHIHTHIHIIHIHTHTYIRTCLHACMHTYIHTYEYMHILQTQVLVIYTL
jgi:hypothetical protein